ncbi:DegT/DnrJ/EryC1/StrS family aminotransferase [uncultured Hoeflea sp.]|uniref:DegT/DnrJ/EryC1/StrS family aminotransferase n=1 Tax=uncultured Hoeflea sp. TaxID=538666 RepID=UPI002632F803|nr:DegT/DnrJ/EryC1/StrS family aminotransferase [uncultured Hoeflea sp.]
MKIEFIDLKAQREHIGERMDKAILDAVNEGRYIHGPQVREFETKLADFCGAKHAIGCANGTDALGLCLMTLGLRPGDAVICPSFTFAATAEVVAWLGATPVFAEIDEATFNIDPKGLDAALETAAREGLKVKALITVDLFGQPADYEPIEAFCKANDLVLIADSAQGFGGQYRGRVAGSIGDLATTSFFPAKPLGCYGDGGAVLTPHDEYRDVIRSLHVHGKGTDKYDNARIGVNSRLDTLQAAILLEKIAVFGDEIAKRQIVAERYADGLAGVVRTPKVLDDCVSTWAQYVVRVPEDKRDAMIEALKAKSVPTAVYYPKPLHQQTAYKRFPVSGNGLPISERTSRQVIALPMHPYLEESVQDYIIDAVRVVATDLGIAD